MVKYQSHLFLTVAIFLCISVSLRGQTSKKALFVILDGIPADVIERVATPGLDAIAKEGAYARAYVGGIKGMYNETPTISAPGYMNLITGTWGNKHNVVDNYNQSPNYNYPNIFRIAKNVNPELQTAIFSTWTDNRTVLVGEGLEETDFFKFDHSFDGLEKDTVSFPHDPMTKYIWDIDKKVTEHAASYLLEYGPDLSWVYLQFTDNVGHGLGNGVFFNKYVKKTDELVSQLWEAIRERTNSHNEDWLVVITTDHGRDAETGKSHGKQSERERTTWVVTNHPDLNKRSGKPVAIVDILPSVLAFLNVQVPTEIKRELDGVSFINQAHAENLRAELEGDKLLLTWNALSNSGEADIYLSFSNNYAIGKKDNYQLLMNEVEVSQGSVELFLSKEFQQQISESRTIKVVMECPNNTINTWLEP